MTTDELRNASAGIDGGLRCAALFLIVAFYRKAVRILHPDKASDGPVDRDAATRALTELFDAAMGR